MARARSGSEFGPNRDALRSSRIMVGQAVTVCCLACAGITWHSGESSAEGDRDTCSVHFSAPPRIEETGTSAQPIVFQGTTFAPGPIEVTYRFDSCRASCGAKACLRRHAEHHGRRRVPHPRRRCGQRRVGHIRTVRLCRARTDVEVPVAVNRMARDRPSTDVAGRSCWVDTRPERSLPRSPDAQFPVVRRQLDVAKPVRFR